MEYPLRTVMLYANIILIHGIYIYMYVAIYAYIDTYIYIYACPAFSAKQVQGGQIWQYTALLSYPATNLSHDRRSEVFGYTCFCGVFFFIMCFSARTNLIFYQHQCTGLPAILQSKLLWTWFVRVSCAITLQHRVLCIMSGDMAHRFFLQQEPVFPWLKDDSWVISSVSCLHFICFAVFFCVV